MSNFLKCPCLKYISSFLNLAKMCALLARIVKLRLLFPYSGSWRAVSRVWQYFISNYTRVSEYSGTNWIWLFFSTNFFLPKQNISSWTVQIAGKLFGIIITNFRRYQWNNFYAPHHTWKGPANFANMNTTQFASDWETTREKIGKTKSLSGFVEFCGFSENASDFLSLVYFQISSAYPISNVILFE